MFLSAFASLRSDPVSRAYYQRKRDQGKRHNQAVLALAHRRILTLHAMIRDGALYDPQPATKLPHCHLTQHIGASRSTGPNTIQPQSANNEKLNLGLTNLCHYINALCRT